MDSATHTTSRVPTGTSAKRSGRTRAVVAAAGLSALVAAASLAAAVPAGATQGTLPPSLKKFIHCPVSNPAVTACLLASTTGTFKINSTTVNLTKPATLSLGLIANSDGSVTAVLPTDGSPGLIAPPASLPGLPGLLGVTAKPQLTGVPTVSLINLFTRSGAAVVLPIDVLLGGNALLGSNCTVGNPSNQIALNLTTGTTSPPPPNQPITGAIGSVHGAPNGVITIKGQTLVDNAFAVPGAYNCGLLGVLDPVIDLAQGLPSAAGTNAAILSGNTYTAPATLIRQYIP